MPEIALHQTPDDRGWVKAIMFFPNDEGLREYAFARMTAEAEVHGLDDAASITVRAKMIRLLLDAPSFKEFQPIKTQAAQAGLIAGDILVMVYLMAEIAKVPKPSVNKAVHAYIKRSKAGGTWHDGRPLPYSESTIRTAWSTHKSVAHLWGAFRVNESYPFAEREDVFGSGWDAFLGVATGLLQFGCKFTPKHLKPPVSILDESQCWLLPETIAPRRLATDRMPDRLLELIKDYKAPQPM
jgi:hypothetical protein